jgi:uncharacterized membrane protein
MGWSAYAFVYIFCYQLLYQTLSYVAMPFSFVIAFGVLWVLTLSSYLLTVLRAPVLYALNDAPCRCLSILVAFLRGSRKVNLGRAFCSYGRYCAA